MLRGPEVEALVEDSAPVRAARGALAWLRVTVRVCACVFSKTYPHVEALCSFTSAGLEPRAEWRGSRQGR